MSLSGSAMTLSSSASHGMLNGGGSELAMPKGKWSDSSSEAGARPKMTDLQRTLEGLAEPSDESRSMDEEDAMVDSSEGASMTKETKTGRASRQITMQAGSSSWARPSAFDDFAKAIVNVVGKGKEAKPMASSSSQGMRFDLRPASGST